MKIYNKLALGTVQWGMPYGVANSSGKPSTAEVHDMLRLARDSGVAHLDTAHAYGDAEKVLGEQGVANQGFKIITKTKSIKTVEVSEWDVAEVSAAFVGSLERLGCEKIYGLMVHRADTLLANGGERLWAALQAMKSQGRVEKIGVSVYHPDQLTSVLARYQIDIVQLPFNIYDQRFSQSGLLRQLRRNGIEVHSRSAFLQGLLLLLPDQMPPNFDFIREHQAHLFKQFRDAGLTPLQGCLQFCLEQIDIDMVVVGCETTTQLMQVLNATQALSDNKLALITAASKFCLTDERVINPSTWA